MEESLAKVGYECIVAVGGDGTLNEVINGFFLDGKPINPRAAVGLIPQGTGGDFRRSFGWDKEVDSAAARLQSDRTEPFDVGLLEYVSHEGKPERRYFANIASLGASGIVVNEVNRTSKALGGRLSFMWGTVRGLVKYNLRTVRLSVDGAPPEEIKDMTTIAIANGRYFGGGMQVAPEALTSDGFFDITIWTGYGLQDFLLKAPGVYSGDHVNWSGTRRLRCKTLSVESEEETLLDVDGEGPGRLPCKATILPGAIRLKV